MFCPEPRCFTRQAIVTRHFGGGRSEQAVLDPARAVLAGVEVHNRKRRSIDHRSTRRSRLYQAQSGQYFTVTQENGRDEAARRGGPHQRHGHNRNGDVPACKCQVGIGMCFLKDQRRLGAKQKGKRMVF